MSLEDQYIDRKSLRMVTGKRSNWHGIADIFWLDHIFAPTLQENILFNSGHGRNNDQPGFCNAEPIIGPPQKLSTKMAQKNDEICLSYRRN